MPRDQVRRGLNFSAMGLERFPWEPSGGKACPEGGTEAAAPLQAPGA
jgi:hypothetical protein